MSTDPPVGSSDPYSDATTQNTDLSWLDDCKPVDVDLHSMVDYAKNMVIVADNLKDHQPRVLDQMRSLVEDAFQGGFPEISVIAHTHGSNMAEFTQYLSFLQAAVNNIGMAAQTVADAYSNTDGWSAATLDAVEFAYGDPDAQRPSGLPAFIGKQGTYYDRYFAQLEDADQNAPKDDAQHTWTIDMTYTVGNSTYTIYKDQNGEFRTVQVVHDGNTETVYDTTDGKTHVTTKTTNTTYFPGGSSTTTTTTADGKPHGRQIVTTYQGTTTTTQYNADGDPTSSSTTVNTADGTTETNYSYGSDGSQHTTSQVTVGTESPGVGNNVDDPGAAAVQDLKNQISN